MTPTASRSRRSWMPTAASHLDEVGPRLSSFSWTTADRDLRAGRTRSPVGHRRDLAGAGCQFLSAPACFTKQTGEAHWVVLHRARAIENGAFFMSAAQAGHHEDGRDTFGHSIIVDPWGRVLAEAEAEPGFILARIDPALVADVRARIPTLVHARSVPVKVVEAR